MNTIKEPLRVMCAKRLRFFYCRISDTAGGKDGPTAVSVKDQIQAGQTQTGAEEQQTEADAADNLEDTAGHAALPVLYSFPVSGFYRMITANGTVQQPGVETQHTTRHIRRGGNAFRPGMDLYGAEETFEG